MNIHDDATVISLFAKGEKSLVANQHLRIEPAFDSIQLLAKRGGLIAAISFTDAIPVARVRENSDYGELLKQALLENCFMPLGSEASGFYQYKKTTIPAGFKMNLTEAKVLWREWWRRTRSGPNYGLQMDLLVFVRDTWYPVRQITLTQEMLFVTTLVKELQLDGSDLVVWLNRTQAQTTERSSSLASPTTTREAPRSPFSTPDLRHIVRFVQGKLYIATAAGEIVVEGQDLHYFLHTTPHQDVA